MPKLRMPVRYGSELKDIEFTDFLNLNDSVKQTIDFPVGVAASAADRAISLGKFLRSSSRGNLLANRIPFSGNIETMTIQLKEAAPIRLFAFAQRVNGCLVRLNSMFELNMAIWTDSTGISSLQFLGKSGVHWLDFVGHDLYLKAAFGVGGYADFHVYGLY